MRGRPPTSFSGASIILTDLILLFGDATRLLWAVGGSSLATMEAMYAAESRKRVDVLNCLYRDHRTARLVTKLILMTALDQRHMVLIMSSTLSYASSQRKHPKWSERLSCSLSGKSRSARILVKTVFQRLTKPEANYVN